MKNNLLYLMFFFCFNSLAQNYNSTKLFEINNGQNSLIKNVTIKNNEHLITIYYVHGFMSLTELHHYLINPQNQITKFIEKQSKDNKLVAFEPAKMTHEEQKYFLKNLKTLFKSKFIKFHPKEFYYENANNKFHCRGNSDMPTIGIIISNNTGFSHYKSYDGYHKLQFCDLINKENLKEFLETYKLFEFKPYNFNAK